jgi:hypothetical protein
LGTRAAEPGCCREDESSAWALFENLELAPLRDSALVHVPSDYELGPGGDKCAQDIVAVAQRPLPRSAPRRSGQMVVQRDHAQSVGRALLEPRHRVRQSFVLERATLLPPSSNRVEADDDEPVADVLGLGRPEDAFPLRERPRETCRDGVRDVVIPRYRQKR